MTERTEYVHGTPSWIDLSTADPEAAKGFYAGIFGWDYEESPAGDEGIYIMASRNGHPVAGMMQQAPEQAEMGLPSMWNSYVSVDDLDATAGRVEGAGGSIMVPPMDIEDAGRMAVIVDPTGAVLSFWEAKEHIGAELVNEHGALTWNELITPDVPAAAAFFAEVLGWGTEEMDMGPMGTYTVWKLGDEQVGGAMNPPMEDMPPHWAVYFHVDDCDGCVAAATTAGASVVAEPMDGPPGRMATLTDPTGATFAVIQPADGG